MRKRIILGPCIKAIPECIRPNLRFTTDTIKIITYNLTGRTIVHHCHTYRSSAWRCFENYFKCFNIVFQKRLSYPVVTPVPFFLAFFDSFLSTCLEMKILT